MSRGKDSSRIGHLSLFLLIRSSLERDQISEGFGVGMASSFEERAYQDGVLGEFSIRLFIL
jgi:hypothetical protein